jgi:hypothetical protein
VGGSEGEEAGLIYLLTVAASILFLLLLIAE